MSNTLTVRLPDELLEPLREKARRTGLPMSRVVRESLEASLNGAANQVWHKFAGIIKRRSSETCPAAQDFHAGEI